MACLKPIEAMQWGGVGAVPGRGWQGHTCRHGPVQAACWWLSECVLGAIRGEVHTRGLRAMTTLQLATCPVHLRWEFMQIHVQTHASIHVPPHHPSNKQAHSLTMLTCNTDPRYQLLPQPQHVITSCDVTLQPHYCGRSLSLAPQHNYSPDEWFGNDRQLELQTVWYWGVHFLPAWVPKVQIKDPHQTKAHIYNTDHSDSEWIHEHHKQNRWYLPETNLVLVPN